MDLASASHWAAEVAVDTIAGWQNTGAPLGWPSKALCPAQDWSCILQSTGGGTVPTEVTESVASRDLRCK